MICNVRHDGLNLDQKPSSENQFFSELIGCQIEDNIASDVASRTCLCPEARSLYCDMYMHCKATQQVYTVNGSADAQE